MATLIFKPTEACNSRCIYCDVVKKKTRGPKRMTFETLELLFRRVNEFLLERPQEDMKIIWHGGEPLLLGPRYFERALHYQEKHCSETFERIEHSIQSNLTLLSREFLEPLRKLGITSIGTSYDPIDNIRGLGKNRDSLAYNQKFIEAIGLLEEEGFNWGVIYVVTKQSLAQPLEIFNFLTNLSPMRGLMINPVLIYGCGLDHLKISPAEYAEFLRTIFPVWWQRRQDFGHIEPFSSVVQNLVEERKSLICAESGACAYSHVDVLPDGRASHCGRSADWGLLDYGSIQEKSFSQIFADPQRESLLQRNTVLPETECQGCRFWDICHGGCPLDGWHAGGSFLHKSDWCLAKQVFLENYVEPLVQGGPLPSADCRGEPGPASAAGRPYQGGHVEDHEDEGAPRWINPLGGLGDTLMISSVLKQAAERFPARRYHLVKRTKYGEILAGHPALRDIGHPPPGAKFISTDYWRHPDFSRPEARAYQILASIFGLEPPVEERLYVPWELVEDPAPWSRLARQDVNVLICQSSDSPRKQMAVSRWEALVGLFKMEEIGVVQVGRSEDRYVRGAHSLLGLTTPRQLISLLRHFEVIVTSDNFLMHAAHLCGVPAVVLWGPTDHTVYGYPGQIHLQARRDCDYPDSCIDLAHADLYPTNCPHGAKHCMNTFDLETIHRAVMRLLNKGKSLVLGRV